MLVVEENKEQQVATYGVMQMRKENNVVKTHDVMQYLKDGIEDNVVCNEECTYIDKEYSSETTNSFEVECTDYET